MKKKKQKKKKKKKKKKPQKKKKKKKKKNVGGRRGTDQSARSWRSGQIHLRPVRRAQILVVNLAPPAAHHGAVAAAAAGGSGRGAGATRIARRHQGAANTGCGRRSQRRHPRLPGGATRAPPPRTGARTDARPLGRPGAPRQRLAAAAAFVAVALQRRPSFALLI
jgi:hypothetical protein